jgi:hypothetical protein
LPPAESAAPPKVYTRPAAKSEQHSMRAVPIGGASRLHSSLQTLYRGLNQPRASFIGKFHCKLDQESIPGWIV